MRTITAPSVMKAIRRMLPPQRRQRSGSASKIRAISRAQARAPGEAAWIGSGRGRIVGETQLRADGFCQVLARGRRSRWRAHDRGGGAAAGDSAAADPPGRLPRDPRRGRCRRALADPPARPAPQSPPCPCRHLRAQGGVRREYAVIAMQMPARRWNEARQPVEQFQRRQRDLPASVRARLVEWVDQALAVVRLRQPFGCPAWPRAVAQQALQRRAIIGSDTDRRVDRESAAVVPCGHVLARLPRSARHAGGTPPAPAVAPAPAPWPRYRRHRRSRA